MEQINAYYVPSKECMNYVDKPDSSAAEAIDAVNIDSNFPNKIEQETETSHKTLVADDKTIKTDSVRGPDVKAENIIYGVESGIYNADNGMYAL